MPSESIADPLAGVLERLEHVCERLTSPTTVALDACAGDLELAARRLADCQQRLSGVPMLDQARQIRRAFLRAQRLLDAAAAFHTNWIRVRGALTAGYTAAGEPGAIVHSSRISIDA